MASFQTQNILVYGLLPDVTFHFAKCCAEDLHKKNPDIFPEPEIKGMLEFEWDQFIEIKKKELQGDTWVFEDKAITFVNGYLVGGPHDFIKWAQETHNWEDFRPMPLYETLAEEAYKTYISSQKQDLVYMNVAIGDEQVGRFLIQLYSDVVPKTCENFRYLCTGEKGESFHEDEGMTYKLSFKNSLFHRIVKNGWVQGGDIWLGKGDGGESVFGDVFEDENFAIPYDRRGILGMANKGRHSNQSQFFITLQKTPWMNTKYVAFGHILEGTETLKRIEAEETINERPLKDIKIVECGSITFEF